MLKTPLTKSLLRTTDNYIKALEKAGITTVWDMLKFFPRDYEDRTQVLDSFSMINLKEKNTILVTLVSLDTTRTNGNKILTKAIIEDKNGFLAEAVWFNRKYLAGQLKVFTWKKILLSGKVKYNYGKVSFTSPDPESDLSKISGWIVPVYSDAQYIPGTWIESKMWNLESYFSDIPENLPEDILKKYNFISRKQAFHKIHFPKNSHDIEVAKARLSYEELYEINYKAISSKHKKFDDSQGKSLAIPLNAEYVKEIMSHIPFELTGGQKIALFQVLKDMEKNHSMQRLLEWDVGTGKTIVSLIATIHAIKESEKMWNKIQVWIMAPTEILARQHFISMEKMLIEFGLTSHLLVGSTTASMKKSIKDELKKWNVDVVIGTHALVQEDVLFHNLGFVVIDEQHRFWVHQRWVLEKWWGNISEYEYTKNITQEEFEKILEIISENPFNKNNLEKKYFTVLKKNGFMVGFCKIYELEDGNSEIGNLWISEKNRNKKLWVKLLSYAIKNTKYSGELYLACSESLANYYSSIGFKKTEDFPHRFDDTMQWAKSENLKYDIMKLETKDKLLSVETLVPHNLNMTATPIPRTLALTLYWDQDLSIISEYPKGRKTIHTKVARNDAQRREIELFIESELGKWRQVFWISPLVEESEKIDLANAVNTYENLVEIFAGFTVGLLHGKMKAKEKEQIMKDFKDNKIQVLSSTSVVEVWVDVPNASIMCIEWAERFGLSQLHQFRGRVWRWAYQSYCYLFPSSGNTTDRLKAMEQTNNGFELSEIDLEIRGPWEVYGVRQSGLPDLKIADITDLQLVSQIRDDIEEMFESPKKSEA